MSQHRTANRPHTQSPISRFFKPATPRITPVTSPTQPASSPATTSSTPPPPVMARGANSPIKAIGKQLREKLQTKVKCMVKVDKTDRPYPKPDVVMTVDRMVREARKLASESEGRIKVSMKATYPWEWWECLYENCSYKQRYYDAKCLHRNVCRCCDNARWTPDFRILDSGLCALCDKECQHLRHLHRACPALIKKQKSHLERRRALPRRINIITTDEVIDLNLQIPPPSPLPHPRALQTNW